MTVDGLVNVQREETFQNYDIALHKYMFGQRKNILDSLIPFMILYYLKCNKIETLTKLGD